MHPITPPTNRAEINRANSLKSTGPKTEAGKKRSSLNALRHGLTGQVIVMPLEDLKKYEAFCQGFHKTYQPANEVETSYVQTIAGLTWKLNRGDNIDTNLLSHSQYKKSDLILTSHDQARDALAMGMAFKEESAYLLNLSLIQGRLDRRLQSNTRQLEQMQAARKAKEAEDMLIAVRLHRVHLHENKAAGTDQVPYDPKVDGFVFSLAQIEACVRRRHLLDLSYTVAKSA